MSGATVKPPRRFGIKRTVARRQLQKAWPAKVAVQPLPAGTPGRVTPDRLGIKDTTPLTVFLVGDHGGIKDPTFQNHVTTAMEAEKPPQLVYSVGDVVYFNGDASEYSPQFYEAYAHLAVPFVAIPGNHDGDTTDDPSRAPLDTFMANFCSSAPSLPAGSEEYNRDTQAQPFCDWTLAASAVTIVGLYTNVPSGGHLEPSQVDWLTGELKAAPADRPVVVTLHHPPYSIDAMHGGSQKMGGALDGAFEASGRCADLVISGHVHNYQRFTRTYWKRQIPYVVVGNSGYHNLHRLAPGAQPGKAIDGADPDVIFEHGEDGQWGYLKLTVSAGRIDGEFVAVSRQGDVTPQADRFAVAAGKVQNAPPAG